MSNLLAEITSSFTSTLPSRLHFEQEIEAAENVTLVRGLRHHVLPNVLPRDENPLVSSQVARSAAEVRRQLFLMRARTLNSTQLSSFHFCSRNWNLHDRSSAVLPLLKSSRLSSALSKPPALHRTHCSVGISSPLREIPQTHSTSALKTVALGTTEKVIPVPEVSVRNRRTKICLCIRLQC